MQRKGLELVLPSSVRRSHLSAHGISSRSMPSDPEKGPSLERNEKTRRSSSTYSVESSITNIINLYGAEQEEKDTALSTACQPQVSRDVVTPLPIKRLDVAHSPPAVPSVMEGARESMWIPSLRLSSVQSSSTSDAGGGNAPNFVEFWRNRHDRRMEYISPLSATASKHRRQVAYGQLTPCAATISTVVRPVSIKKGEFVLRPLSDTIGEVMDADLVPPPLELGRMSRGSKVLERGEAVRGAQHLHLKSIGRLSGRNSSATSWPSDDSFVIDTGVGEVIRAKIKKKLKRGKAPGKREMEGVLSDAPDTYPTMERKLPGTSGKRRSLHQDVSEFIRSLSPSGHPGRNPRRQLAIPPTPHHQHGREVWWAKKEERREEMHDAQRVMTVTGRRSSLVAGTNDLVHAYHNGQRQFVDVLEGARQKLVRRPSEKRRAKLKESIVVVGPTEFTPGRNSVEEGPRWI